MKDKRVIIEHRTSPKAGLKEFARLLSELQTFVKQPGVPSFVPGVNFGDRIADLELARVESTYVLYREIIPKPTEDDGA